MKKLLKKIPLLIWVIILSVIAYLAAKNNWISDFTDKQEKLLAGFLTFIGLIFVAVNLQRQWKNERIKTEYLNQPDFEFKGFTSDLIGSTPMLCGNPAECTDDHWLNILQVGNLAARNLKVALFHESEAEQNVEINNRWLTTERLAKNNTFQYKLPLLSVPFSYFNATQKNCFILLIEYSSEYSKIKYKRIYHFCSSPVQSPKSTAENDWKGRIIFYASSLENAIDTDSITVKEILLNFWFSFARWSKLKKDYDYKAWLINI